MKKIPLRCLFFFRIMATIPGIFMAFMLMSEVFFPESAKDSGNSRQVFLRVGETKKLPHRKAGIWEMGNASCAKISPDNSSFTAIRSGKSKLLFHGDNKTEVYFITIKHSLLHDVVMLGLSILVCVSFFLVWFNHHLFPLLNLGLLMMLILTIHFYNAIPLERLTGFFFGCAPALGIILCRKFFSTHAG